MPSITVCPKCGSDHCQSRPKAKYVGGAILGALAGAVAGGISGARLGEKLDHALFNQYQCLTCGHVFSR